PGIINRVTRAMLPTRLAFEIASRFEIRRELIAPADFMPYLEGMARIDARLFVAMLAAAGAHSAEDLLPAVTAPTIVVAGGRGGVQARGGVGGDRGGWPGGRATRDPEPISHGADRASTPRELHGSRLPRAPGRCPRRRSHERRFCVRGMIGQ